MTSVEPNHSTHHLLSDGRTESLHSKLSTSSVSTTKKRRVPPAVPSPPRITSPSEDNLRGGGSLYRKDADRMEEQERDQWFFTEAELASTPSIIDGVLPVDERCRRAKGVNFIIQAGIMLKLPQLTLATASVFFHRYFMRVSMVPEKGGQHHYNIAATALFLATKTEENCRKTKEIVIAVAKVAQKNPNLLIDEQSKEYWKWRDNLLTFEEHMLEMLTFDVVIEPPYTCLWRFLQQLQLEDNKAIRNAAWAFINDSCLTPLCLLITPQDIAISAIYFASKSTKESISDDANGNPWWKQIDGNISNIAKGLNVMADFWMENPLNRNDNPWTMSPLNDDNDRDKTRKSQREYQSPSPAERRGSHGSQNGYIQRNGAPLNGTKSIKDEPSPVKPHDIPAPTTESDNPSNAEVEVLKIEEPVGSSDAALKTAANDPATHEHTNAANGLAADVARPTATASPNTPKRKRDEDVEEPSAKRVKAEDSLEEEGEIEA